MGLVPVLQKRVVGAGIRVDPQEPAGHVRGTGVQHLLVPAQAVLADALQLGIDQPRDGVVVRVLMHVGAEAPQRHLQQQPSALLHPFGVAAAPLHDDDGRGGSALQRAADTPLALCGRPGLEAAELPADGPEDAVGQCVVPRVPTGAQGRGARAEHVPKVPLNKRRPAVRRG